MSNAPDRSSTALARKGAWGLHLLAVCGALAAIFLFTAALFGATIITYGNGLLVGIRRSGFFASQLPQSLAIVALTACLTFGLVVRGRPLPPVSFVLAAVVGALGLYALYINAFEPVWVSDFRSMWNVAGALVSEGRFHAETIHQQRVLPLLVPAVYLFGHESLVAIGLNVACLIAILLMGYDILARSSGHLAAQIFTVLWIAAAEPLFSVKIPTHDLWGLLFCALALWTLVRVLARQGDPAWRTLVLGGLVAVPIALLEVQRELGLVALLAIATAALIYCFRPAEAGPTGRGPSRRALLLVLVGAFVGFGALNVAFERASILTSDPAYLYLSNLRNAALAPGYSDGTYNYARAFGDAFLIDQPDAAQTETARAMVLSDTAEQPGMRLAGMAAKIGRIAKLGGQGHFYFNELRSSDPGLVAFLTSYNQLYAMLFSALFFAALPMALDRRRDMATLVSLAFMGVLIGGLVTIGETQPRYAFPVWFFGALVIAAQLSRPLQTSATAQRAVPRTIVAVPLGTVVIVVSFFAVHLALDRFYGTEDGRIMAGFTLSSENVDALPRQTPLGLDQRVENNRTLGFGQLAFILAAGGFAEGGSSISARTTVCAGEDRTGLRFAYLMPYVNPDVMGAFTLRVLFNDRQVFEQQLPDGGEFRDVHLPQAANPSECGALDFVLDINRSLQRDSWVRASRTEIYFPRLSQN